MNLFQPQIQQVSLWAMLGAGLMAFVSPCVLPMLPVYALYLMGGTEDAQKPSAATLIKRCLGLTLGFMLLYVLMGAGAGLLGSALKNADRGTLNIISGALMILFGLRMLEIFRLPALHLPAGLSLQGRRMNGFFGSFLFGLVMAISFTSCLTPLLANALVMAASQDGATMWTGVAHLAVFSLGLCIPMLACMLLYQWLKGMIGWLRTHQQLIRRIGGGLMILYGLYLILSALL
ncbi:MAG: cytochrome c biogenesis protein CcdA [Clostridiales bacterium]|nr:cytochrome c biogenesis protein CcdA [Clostridiales bacterium]